LRSFLEPGEAGFGSAASVDPEGSGMPCSRTTATSGSCASSSLRTSKLFLFSGREVSARGEGS